MVCRLQGMVCWVGVWNAGYSVQFNMTKRENDIFVSMNHDSMSKTKALLTSLKF